MSILNRDASKAELRAAVAELEAQIAKEQIAAVTEILEREARIEAVRALVESMYEGRHPSYSAAPDTPDLRWFGELRAALAAVPPETPQEML